MVISVDMKSLWEIRVQFKLFVLLLISWQPICHASEKLLVVTEEWPPYNFVNEHGELDGIATQNIKKILQHAKIQYEIKLLPWSVGYTLAQKDPNVLLYTLYRIPEREDKFKWICPVVQSGGIKAFKLKSRKDIIVNNFDDLKKYSIGVGQKNAPYHYLLNKGFEPGKHLDVNSSTETSLRLFLMGRNDIFLQEEAAMAFRLEKLGSSIEQVTPLIDLLPNSIEKCAALSLDADDKIINKLQQSIRELNLDN
mgnify:CR=1 FL=1